MVQAYNSARGHMRFVLGSVPCLHGVDDERSPIRICRVTLTGQQGAKEASKGEKGLGTIAVF